MYATQFQREPRKLNPINHLIFLHKQTYFLNKTEQNNHFTGIQENISLFEKNFRMNMNKTAKMQKFISGKQINQGYYKSFQPNFINRDWEINNLVSVHWKNRNDSENN